MNKIYCPTAAFAPTEGFCLLAESRNPSDKFEEWNMAGSEAIISKCLTPEINGNSFQNIYSWIIFHLSEVRMQGQELNQRGQDFPVLASLGCARSPGTCSRTPAPGVTSEGSPVDPSKGNEAQYSYSSQGTWSGTTPRPFLPWMTLPRK